MKSQHGSATVKDMPDVASSASRHIHSSLDWVGMSEIHLPAKLSDTLAGERPISASIQAYVNLQDPAARGIHMSRLYLTLEETFADCSVSAASIGKLLATFLGTHQGLSDKAFVQLDFEYSMRRESLKSNYFGWKSYPVSICGTLRSEEHTSELQSQT